MCTYDCAYAAEITLKEASPFYRYPLADPMFPAIALICQFAVTFNGRKNSRPFGVNGFSFSTVFEWLVVTECRGHRKMRPNLEIAVFEMKNRRLEITCWCSLLGKMLQRDWEISISIPFARPWYYWHAVRRARFVRCVERPQGHISVALYSRRLYDRFRSKVCLGAELIRTVQYHLVYLLTLLLYIGG